MDWNNWKTWLLVAGALVALVAIYAFAGSDDPMQQAGENAQPTASTESRAGIRTPVASKGKKKGDGEIQEIVEINAQPGTNVTRRDLFAFVEAPIPVIKVPTTPVIAPPAPPPPDGDKDSVPDFRDNCPAIYNPDQTDIDRNGVGAACQQGKEIPPPPPLPAFTYKYIGTFGSARSPLATFSKGGEVINVRIGETFGDQFILRNIGIESVDIGYVGRSEQSRIPIGQ